MPRRAPWFKLDAHWWLTDSRVQSMNATAVGGLIRLLCIAWGDGSREPLLPTDPVKLREMAKLTEDEWSRYGADILELTAPSPSGLHLYFPVQMEQWNDMRESYERRASAGSVGGKTKAERARKPKPNNGSSTVTPVDAAWARIRAAYPRRHGDQGWRAAEARFRNIVKAGADPEQIVSSVEAYYRFMDAQQKVGTAFVKKAETFFGRERCWEENWVGGPPSSPAPTRPPAGPGGAGRTMLTNLVKPQ